MCYTFLALLQLFLFIGVVVMFPWIPETVCGHWLRTRFINGVFFSALRLFSESPDPIVIVHGASEPRGKIHSVMIVRSRLEMALLPMSTFLLLFFFFFVIQTNTCLQRVACGPSVLVSLQNNYQLTSWPSKGQEQRYKCSYVNKVEELTDRL